MEVLARYAPGTPITTPLAERAAPISNQKARDLLGFRQLTDWTTEVAALTS